MFFGLKIPMGMVSDLSEGVRGRLSEIRRFCSYVGRSHDAKIWVT